MTRYRLRIVLLTLGVVLGFGSAARQALGYGPHHHCHASPRE